MHFKVSCLFKVTNSTHVSKLAQPQDRFVVYRIDPTLGFEELKKLVRYLLRINHVTQLIACSQPILLQLHHERLETSIEPLRDASPLIMSSSSWPLCLLTRAFDIATGKIV